MKNIKIVCFGEVLWDNLKDGRRLGGAPLNVCYHLNKRGIPSAIVSQVGNDENGRDILAEIDVLSVNRDYCYISNDKPTSTVEVHIEGDKINYEIVEEVAWDHIPFSEDLASLVNNAEVLLYGSLVTRNEVSRNTLMQLLPHAKFKVFDVNLRAPFYSKERIETLIKVSNLLKMNEDELEVLCDWWGIEVNDDAQRLKAILKKFESLQEIILTKGGDGASYCSRTKYVSAPAKKIEVDDTIGSGDAFLATFLASKILGKTIPDALEDAINISGYIATKPGACPPYEVKELIK